MSGRRGLSWWERALEPLVTSRPGAWFMLNVANPLDRRLLRLTRGRVGVLMGQPVGLLETVGAKTGEARTTPLAYIEDADRVVLVASSGGAARHPAWFHNLSANPEVHFSDRRGARRRYRARLAEGPERERLWRAANDFYAGYDTYQGRTRGRRIPVVVLEPLARADAP